MLKITSKMFRLLVVSSLLLLVSCSSGGGGGDDSSDSGVPALSEVAIGEGAFSLQLSWEESSQREDGSPIGSPLSYLIHYSFNAQAEQVIEVGASNSVLLIGLEPGDYTFAVSSVDASRMESALSERLAVTVN